MREEDLERRLEAARAAWGFAPSAAQLRDFLGRDAGLDEGVAIACGLLHGLPEAAAVFERLIVPRVRAGLQRAGARPDELDEMVQATRVRLVVDNGGARLKQYRGHGSFAAFVVTVALRLFTNARVATRPAEGDEALARLPGALELERAMSRGQSREHFARAFQGALDALEPRQRALLKLSLVDGVSIDGLAPIYEVSRATVARWLADARGALRGETLRRLKETTRTEGDALEGLMTSLESGFDVSLPRFITAAALDDT